jgi:flavin-dependent dehydrogenase
MTASSHDVLILGGGLAGLTCALHLRQDCPQLDIRVLERRAQPAPAATHKVGESTVEIGAHYFAKQLGLQEHLEAAHLRKFGFRFFNSDGRSDIDAVQEIGVSRLLSVPSYQIDRGIFENHLLERARAQGIAVDTDCQVESLDLAAGPAAGPLHAVSVRSGGATRELRGRWLIDASGRAGLLKRQLGLAEPNRHDANAIWFRVPVRIDIEDWSQDARWLGRCELHQRWRSTNHLVGDGYWVWLIPLSSGYHSVGIVADATLHPLKSMNTFERTLEWLGRHQPRLRRALLEAGVRPTDFSFLRNFSYGCGRNFSSDRWAITGEAGVFLDPFYSPGSDFIAIANTFIADLVRRDFRGESFGAYVASYGQIFRSIYDNTLTLYQDQYRIFGDPQVLATKVIWDYAYYWGVLCQMFFQGRLTDLATLGRVREATAAANALNAAMQQFLRAWALRAPKQNEALQLDQAGLPWFDSLNRSLLDELDAAGFVARIQECVAQLERLAAEVVGSAIRGNAGVATWPEAQAVIALCRRAPVMDAELLRYPLSA